MTNFNVKRDDLRMEPEIGTEHVKSSRDLREVLTKRGIVPEELPPDEDIKKVERRVASEEKRLPRQVKPLESPEEEADDQPV